MRELSRAFGPDLDLVGTVCLPDGAADEQGLLLFNAGVVHRIGPHRTHVRLAREMAVHGVASIRFDLHGMGDSPRSNTPRAYSEQVVADLRCAMDELSRTSGARRFALLGFCSGVPQAWEAALADSRVSTLILYDGLVLVTPGARLRHLWLRLRAHGISPQALRLWWRRGIAQIGLTLARLRRPARRDQEEARMSRSRAFEILQRLRQRGVEVIILNAGADFSEFNHADQARLAMGAHARGLQFGFLDSVDHVLTSRQAQETYVAWVREQIVGRRA